MTPLDELLEEMQSTWTGDGKRKQMIIERSQLEQALLSEAVRQLKRARSSGRASNTGSDWKTC